jgi:hypothetical protein
LTLDDWLVEVDTDPALQCYIVEYAKGRGGYSMEWITGQAVHPRYKVMARHTDMIGWRRFMEGMISKSLQDIQSTYASVAGPRLSMTQWMTGVIVKLLKITHGQWLYRCIQVHESATGTLWTARKEELQHEIEAQQDMGSAGLLEDDQFLAEVNLDDLELSSGEQQEYWLLAIQAAREAGRLKGLQQPPAHPGNGFDRGRD